MELSFTSQITNAAAAARAAALRDTSPAAGTQDLQSPDLSAVMAGVIPALVSAPVLASPSSGDVAVKNTLQTLQEVREDRFSEMLSSAVITARMHLGSEFPGNDIPSNAVTVPECINRMVAAGTVSPMAAICAAKATPMFEGVADPVRNDTRFATTMSPDTGASKSELVEGGTAISAPEGKGPSNLFHDSFCTILSLVMDAMMKASDTMRQVGAKSMEQHWTEVLTQTKDTVSAATAELYGSITDAVVTFGFAAAGAKEQIKGSKTQIKSTNEHLGTVNKTEANIRKIEQSHRIAERGTEIEVGEPAPENVKAARDVALDRSKDIMAEQYAEHQKELSKAAILQTRGHAVSGIAGAAGDVFSAGFKVDAAGKNADATRAGALAQSFETFSESQISSAGGQLSMINDMFSQLRNMQETANSTIFNVLRNIA